MDNERVAKVEPNEEEKERDRENGKKEYQSNITKTYKIKNRSLDIKIGMMEVLYKHFMELEGKIDTQSPEGKIRTLGVMAQIGAAVIPD